MVKNVRSVLLVSTKMSMEMVTVKNVPRATQRQAMDKQMGLNVVLSKKIYWFSFGLKSQVVFRLNWRVPCNIFLNGTVSYMQ